MVWEIISSAATAISVIVAVITHFIDRYDKKKAETINAIDRVLDSYYEFVRGKGPKVDYDGYVHFMSIVERFSTDVNEGILLEKVVKDRLSVFLTKEYDKNMKNEIEKRRKQFSRGSYYEQVEKLIKNLQ